MFITRLNKDEMISARGGPIRGQRIPLPESAGAPFRCVFGNIRAGQSGSEDGHPAAEIYLFLEGHAWLTIGDQQYDVQPGDVYFIPPNLPHGVDNRAGITDVTTLALFWET